MEIAGQHFSIAEFIGTLSGLIAVWLTVKENKWCFPIGIISSIVYAYVFFSPSVKYYADAILQIVYVVLLVYGWINWTTRKQNSKALPVTRFILQQQFSFGLIILLSTILIGFLFNKYTDASLPFVDALTTSMSLVAQWMVAKKKIENWHLWIAANLIYVYMYLHKELYITSIFYFVLLILAFAGLKEWKKHLVNSSS